MSACLLVLGLLLACPEAPSTDAPAPPPPPTRPATAAPTRAPLPMAGPADDAWIGEDKLRHFAMSFAAVSFGYGAARFTLDRDPAALAAAGATLAAGVAKEVHDLRAGRAFSVRDLLWDVAGVAAALTLVERTR